MKHLTSLLALLIVSATIEAATVSVTMNATAKTMTLTPAGSSTAIAEDSHEGDTYVFNGVANGDYVIEGFNTSGISNGTINIHVADEDITLQLWLATSRATNSKWIIGTDYTAENLSIRTREGGVYTGTIGYNMAAPYTASTTMTALIPDGGSFNIELVPNAAHQAEGYMSAYPSATFTANATQNMAIPMGGMFTCSCPADAELALFRKPGGASGSGSIHFVPFITIEPTNVVVSGSTKTFTYRLGDATTYNIRTWRAGGLTNCTQFKYSTDATKCPVINYTDEHYAARDPKWIDHDPTHNDRLNAVDIFININKEGHKRMSVGEQYDLVSLRDWQIIPDQTSNYFFEPDYHYAVYDLEGNPDNSVVEVVGDGVIGSQWAFLRAKTPGTAIVTVTFDAACATKWNNNVENDYYGGRYYSALWPENTAVFVVTVGDGANAIVPNMLINEDYNLEGGKMSWKYLDAEHDVLYYINDEEYAEYTFTPSNVTTVDIAYPTIRTNDAVYDNGWENVADNGDGSYTLHLVHGSQIVRLGDGQGHYVYQVVRAKHATRSITNMSTGSTTRFCPGDEVKIQYDGLFHPANKLSGIYNMSAYITYNGNPTGTALILGSNQYWFAGTPSAQAVTVTIPYDYTDPTFDLTEGVIQVHGYGDQIGNHRNLNKVAGRSPNFTATVGDSYFGALPDISFPVTQRKVVKATINVVPAEASVEIKNAIGEVLTPESDGTYLLKEGITSLFVQHPGYKRETQTIEITEDMPDEKTFDVALTPIPANGWDGETTQQPSKVGGIYIITSGYELAWFAAEVQKGTATTIAYNAQLANDIDLCGYPWTPISDVTASAKAYKGTFDGNGMTVKNMYVERTITRAGLFAYINTGCEIKNLTVEGTVISTAADSRAAGIVGHINGTGKVTNCVNKANVSGLKYVTGIAGYLAGGGVVDRCANYGDITGATPNSGQYMSGIAFNYNLNAKITNCYNQGTILGDNYCGGIYTYSGTGSNSTVTNVYNTGYVHASGENSNGYSCHGAIRPTTSTTVTTAKVTNAYANQDFLFNELSTTIIEDEARWQSGEVAFRLGDAFGQEIGVDPLPVIGGPKVYKMGEGESAIYYNEPCFYLTLSADVEGATYTVKNHNGSELTLGADGRYKVLSGSYYYSISKEGYETYADTVEISDKDEVVTVTLMPIVVYLTLSANVEDATYTVLDENEDEISPDVDGRYKVTTGSYYYSISKDGYKTYTGMVTITDKDAEVTVTLTQELVYTRTVTAGSYGTICLPWASVSYTGASFYEIAYYRAETNRLVLDEVTQLEAGMPYLFVAESEEFRIHYYADGEVSEAGHYNGFYGTLAVKTFAAADVNTYIVYQNNLLKVRAGDGVAANRGYIKLNEVSGYEVAPAPGRKRVELGGGNRVTTELEEVQSTHTDTQLIYREGRIMIIRGDKMYDMNGRMIR